MATIDGYLRALEQVVGDRAVKGFYRVCIRVPDDVNKSQLRRAIEALDLRVVKRNLNGVRVFDVWWATPSTDFYRTAPQDESPLDLQPRDAIDAVRVPSLTLSARSGSKPTLCIVGAAGSVGKATLMHLVANEMHHRFDIRCTGDLRERFPQVSWAGAVNLRDAAQTELFLTGCHHLLVSFAHTLSMEDRYLQAQLLFDAAKRQRVGQVTLLSVAGADRSVSEWHAHEFHQLERVLQAEPLLRACFVRPHLFMENLAPFSPDVLSDGLLEFPLGQYGRVPLIALDDVGRFCATVVTQGDVHAHKAYTLTGGEALSGQELAQIMERVLQRAVVYQEDTSSVRVRELLASMPEWEQDRFMMWTSLLQSGGGFDVLDDYKRVTGHAPTTVADWVVRNASLFGPNAPFPGIPLRGKSVIAEGAMKGTLSSSEMFPGFDTAKHTGKHAHHAFTSDVPQ